MWAKPWCTTRFSPFFLNVFFGLPAASLPVSGVAASCASFLAMCPLLGLLLGDRALARSLARARVRARALATCRQIPAMPRSAVAADFDQALDAHRDLLAEIAFHAADLFNHPADLADVVFRQVLDPDVPAHARGAEDVVRTA